MATVADSMKAVGIAKHGPAAEVLVDVSIPTPAAPAGFDILVEVQAVALNPVDYKVRAGMLGDATATYEAPKVLGWDAAGIVLAAGPEALFKAGDEVFFAGDITRAGTNQQKQLVDSRIVGRKPKSLSMEQAAAFPLVSLTAFEALFERLCIKRSAEDQGVLLIINASGGVGSVALQLAKKLAPGLKVVGTAGKPASVEWVQGLGADAVISHYEPLQPQLVKLGGVYTAGADFVFICHDITPESWKDITSLTKPFGRINTIVLHPDQQLNMQPMYFKSITFGAEAMFTRSLFKTPCIAQQHDILNNVAQLLDEGVLKPIALQSLGAIKAANVSKGHQLLEDGHVIGKLTLASWE